MITVGIVETSTGVWLLGGWSIIFINISIIRRSDDDDRDSHLEKVQISRRDSDGLEDLLNFNVEENFPSKRPRWIPGTVVEVTGLLSYNVKLENGSIVRRHIDSVK